MPSDFGVGIESGPLPAMLGNTSLALSPPRSAETTQLYRFMATQIFSDLYLQKFAIALPGLPPVSILMPIMLAGIGYMLIISQLRISLVRATFYSFLLAAVLFSHLLVETKFSLPSLLLLTAMCSLLVVAWQVEWDFYEKILSLFLKLMVPASILVLMQIAWHAVTGQTLSLERIVPKVLLLPGYNYEAPIQFGATFIRPNGVFMLEPAVISLFLGAAILTDFMYFRRVWRLLLFAAALVGCMAATGVVLVGVALPFILVKQSPGFLLATAALCTAGLLITVPLGLADHMLSRFSELDPTVAINSSAGQRMLLPAEAMVTTLGDSHYLFTGLGAGQTDKVLHNPWPMVKLAKEYGLIVMAIYMVLFLVSVSWCPNLPLTVGLLFLFHLTGGYLLDAASFELIVILCSICTPVTSPKAALV